MNAKKKSSWRCWKLKKPESLRKQDLPRKPDRLRKQELPRKLDRLKKQELPRKHDRLKSLRLNVSKLKLLVMPRKKGS